eukprot:TRINITY_DN5687_c0_g4_i1.p2 TRINITY_DN5687_c0_g4~~TRINITY_DN5687_c0_g4_i1.p2  ORF type:complete len:149 (-),score=3.24 TRINITY_DN5687_c0_g4_i1:91-537(-)
MKTTIIYLILSIQFFQIFGVSVDFTVPPDNLEPVITESCNLFCSNDKDPVECRPSQKIYTNPCFAKCAEETDCGPVSDLEPVTVNICDLKCIHQQGQTNIYCPYQDFYGNCTSEKKPQVIKVYPNMWCAKCYGQKEEECSSVLVQYTC